MLTSFRLLRRAQLSRMQHDAVVPLTRITLLAGPNGSGKSTALDALRELVFGHGHTWQGHDIPVQVEGTCQALFFLSSELDNPRLLSLRGPDGRPKHAQLFTPPEAIRCMDAREMSHGQSNYRELEGTFTDDRFDVVVMDEPENALDLDGLGWLASQICATTKQVIVATHNPILLSLMNAPGGSVQVFGTNPDYATRVLDVYGKVVAGHAFGNVQKRKRPTVLEVAARKPRQSRTPAGRFDRS